MSDSARRPVIDVVIPVHTEHRPIARAVGSVLAAQHSGVRAIVVCHGVDLRLIADNLGELVRDPRLQLVPFSDGIPSPAGPLNEGVRVARAQYVTFLGSDDVFQAGALDAWVEELAAGPDILIGQLLTETGGRIWAPAPRVGRFERLDPSRDLLNTRSAPVATLIARELLLSPWMPDFASGERTGEDLGLGLVLWNTAENIAYSRCAAGYYGHEDGTDRVTAAPLSPFEVQRPVRGAVALPVLASLSRRRRQAIAVKLLRHQVLDWVRAMDRRGTVDDELLREAGETIRNLLGFAPGVFGYFHRFDAAAIRAIEQGDLEAMRRHSLRGEQTPFRWKMIPNNPFRTFAPENAAIRIRRTNRLLATLSVPEPAAGSLGRRS